MLNLKFYTGNDLYSDGDIEDELLEIFKEGKDVEKVIANDNRWPILYHLSPIRKNILEWYPFDKNQTLLEVGSGCGAITELFCERLQKVTCIELSKRRSMINKERNKNHDNLEIIVANFNDVEIDEKFDYITLIGVLEYTKSFIKTDNPYKTLFDKLKKWLKPNGKIIIAIENKFGLKYWAGAKDDHTSEHFDSIEGYCKKNNYNRVETFGLNELKDNFKNNNFTNIEFYYPYPDYKFVETIFSEECLPEYYQLARSPHYDQVGYKLFNESAVYRNLLQNGMFAFFSNSYLCFVGN